MARREGGERAHPHLLMVPGLKPLGRGGPSGGGTAIRRARIRLLLRDLDGRLGGRGRREGDPADRGASRLEVIHAARREQGGGLSDDGRIMRSPLPLVVGMDRSPSAESAGTPESPLTAAGSTIGGLMERSSRVLGTLSSGSGLPRSHLPSYRSDWPNPPYVSSPCQAPHAPRRPRVQAGACGLSLPCGASEQRRRRDDGDSRTRGTSRHSKGPEAT